MLNRMKNKSGAAPGSGGKGQDTKAAESPATNGLPLAARSAEQSCKRLGDMLVDEGVITEEQLQEALAARKEQRGFLGQILVDSGYIDQDTLVEFLVKQCKIPHIHLRDYDVGRDLLKLIPEDLCIKHALLPIDKLGKILTVAMVDPFDVVALEEVRKACPDIRIKAILCNWQDYMAVAQRSFKLGDEESSKEEAPQPPSSKPDADNAPDTKAKAPVKADTEESKVEAAVESLVQEAAGAEEKTPQPPQSPPPAQVDEGAAPVRARPRPTAPGGAFSPDIAALMRESVQEAVREAALALAAKEDKVQRPEPAAASDVAAMLRDGVRDGVQQAVMALQALQADARPAPEEPHREERPGSSEESGALLKRIEELLATVTSAAQAAQDAATRAANEAEAAAAAHSERVTKKRKHVSVQPLAVGPSADAESGEPEVMDERVRAALDSERPAGGFTFTNFFVGRNNEFTCELAKAVSANPGGKYNPFFLYGEVGTGKTHLINAIGNAILAGDAPGRVGFVSSSRFASRLGDAAADKALDAFRADYCHWEVLIVDDVQFLGGRLEAQEEFFHIFNALHQEGRQIILAGDRPPDQLGQLERRLVSRFASGVVAQLRSPEWETRMAILHHHVSEAKKAMPEEVLSLVAMRVPHDVRKMTGSLRKIVAFAELVGQDITCDLANEILSHLDVDEAA